MSLLGHHVTNTLQELEPTALVIGGAGQGWPVLAATGLCLFLLAFLRFTILLGREVASLRNIAKRVLAFIVPALPVLLIVNLSWGVVRAFDVLSYAVQPALQVSLGYTVFGALAALLPILATVWLVPDEIWAKGTPRIIRVFMMTALLNLFVDMGFLLIALTASGPAA